MESRMKKLTILHYLLKIYYTLCTIKMKISLSHTHTDGKDKLLEWPDRSCLLLYVSARIH